VVRRRLVLLVALLLAPLTTDAQDDRMTAVRFTLTVDGHAVVTFTELGSIVAEAKALEFFDGSTQGRGVVTLSRPASTDLEMSSWHESAMSGNVAARKRAILVAYNRRGDPTLRYHLENAWPAKVEISWLKTSASETLMETVTIVSERIQRVAN
jgi:phage tail-like protein